MTGEWFVPRLLALLSVVSVVLAVASTVEGWYGWQAVAGLLCAAAAAGFVAGDMAWHIRRRHDQERQVAQQIRWIILVRQHAPDRRDVAA